MKEHRCNAACSWRVDEVALRRMGYDIPIYTGDDPFAGVSQKVKHQSDVARVLNQAVADGKVRVCTKTHRTNTGEEPAWSKTLHERGAFAG